LHLGIEACAIRTAHDCSYPLLSSWPGVARRKTRVNALMSRPSTSMRCRAFSSCIVDREPPDQCLDPLAHRRLHQRILVGALLRQRIEHFGDQLTDLPELGDAEAARSAGRRAEPDARRNGGLLRVVGNAVL